MSNQHKFHATSRHDEGKHHHRPSSEAAAATAIRDDEETAADRMHTVDRIDGDDSGRQPSEEEVNEAIETFIGGESDPDVGAAARDGDQG